MTDPHDSNSDGSTDWVGILAIWLAMLGFGLAAAIAMIWGAWLALVTILSWLA